ncbi:TPA: hypothetical protein RD636_002582, partial [Enterococcus faecalis]|nr:hypothetical protein [Enterococcus faecalis]
WKPQVEHFKRNNQRVKVLFEDTKIDKDALWHRYTTKVEQQMNSLASVKNYGDSSHIYEIYEDKMIDAAELFWHAISIHKFQYLMLLCQTWENELIIFVTKELKNYYELSGGLTYSDIINKILSKNMNLSDIKGLDKINELRLLVNVIKHGEGDSAKKLRKKRPDFFKFETEEELTKYNDRMEIWNSILLENAALNVDDSEFYLYFNAINNFWDSMPTRLYLDGNTAPIYE